MLKQAIKTAAWLKAPKAMFAITNPKKAAVIKGIDWAAEMVGRPRRRRSPLRTAVKGMAAAAVAIPAGIWLGKKVLGGEGSEAENY